MPPLFADNTMPPPKLPPSSTLRRKIHRLQEIDWLSTVAVALGNTQILHWSDDPVNAKNFGDAINPLVFSATTARQVVSARRVLNPFRRPEFYFIGSILDGLNRASAVVCGAGFQKQDARVQKRPRKILAVRGPRTHELLERQGIPCPQTYCDPALLLPNFWPKQNQKNWDVGIILHYADKTEMHNRQLIAGDLTYKFINIEGSTDEVIHQICASKIILSSSLHGVIVAHAYGVPATWIRLSDNVIGGSFKFDDYYESVGGKTRCYSVEKNLALEHGCAIATLHSGTTNATALQHALREYFK